MNAKLIIFISGICLILGLRATSPQRYSEWAFGDAQTVLAVENWRVAGFLETHFLWIPQAYSVVTKYFDDAELSHHAHGVTVAGRSYRAYTHYPGWYAFPYGVLAKLGIVSKRVFHLFALIVSLCGLYFFLHTIAFQQGDRFALVATITFLLHESFLGYSDALSNVPYDDLFKFWIFYRWQTLDGRKGLVTIAALYFLLCLTSFDSVFVVPIFIVAYDFFFRKLAYRRYLVVGSAGALGMAFLIAQNSMYFGSVNTALVDWFGQIQSNFRFGDTFRAIHAMVVRDFRLGAFSWGFILLWLATVIRGKDRKNLYFGITLLLSGLAYAYVFPARVGGQRYIHRLLTPFLAFSSTTLLYHWIVEPLRNFKTQRAKAVGCLSALVFLAYHTHGRSFPTYFDFPARSRVSADLEQTFSRMREHDRGDKVYFEIGHFLEHHGPGTQISPLVEAVVGAPVLFAENIRSAARDSTVLWKKTNAPFRIYFLFPPGATANLREIEGTFLSFGVRAKAQPIFADGLAKYFEVGVYKD